MPGVLRALVLLAVAPALVFPVALARTQHAAQPFLHRLDGWTMGSTWSLAVAAPATLDDAALRVGIERRLASLDDQLSTWRDDTALSALNRAPVGRWVALPPDLAAVIRYGQFLHDDSGGAFDLTVKPLVNLWGFGSANPRTTLPSAAEIAAARARLGSDRLEISTDGRQVRRLADVTVDDDAIAPGYAADALAAWLAQRGLRDVLVEVGGELRASGRRPDGRPWAVGIEQPALAHDGLAAVVGLRDAGISTSGDYRDFSTIDGHRYSHEIDPASGYPADHALVSVTVVAPTTMAADGAATVLMVLGPDRGMAWANARRLPVYMAVRTVNGTIAGRYNEAFAALPASP